MLIAEGQHIDILDFSMVLGRVIKILGDVVFQGNGNDSISYRSSWTEETVELKNNCAYFKYQRELATEVLEAGIETSDGYCID